MEDILGPQEESLPVHRGSAKKAELKNTEGNCLNHIIWALDTA